MMRIRRILCWTLLLAFIVFVGLYVRKEVRIDSCLDRGGRWDEDRQRCEGLREQAS